MSPFIIGAACFIGAFVGTLAGEAINRRIRRRIEARGQAALAAGKRAAAEAWPWQTEPLPGPSQPDPP